MKYLDRIKRNITRLTPGDQSALIAFQKEIEDPDLPPFDKQHYQWAHEKNPHRRAGGPQFWIYRKEDGTVHGQQVGIPFSLSVQGKPYTASWAVDLMVRPEFRMRGIGNALSEVLRQESDITVGIGITDDAYQSCLRAGWINLGKMQVFLRPLDTKRMLPLFNRSPDNVIHWTAATLCNTILYAVDLGCSLLTWFSGVKLEKTEEFDRRVDQVWEAASKFYPVIAKRDFKSLQWRFDAVAEARHYQRFYLYKDGNICGYVVVRNSKRDGVAVATIVDFLCPPSLIAPLMANCITTLRRSGAAVIYCRASFPRASKYLYPLGFCKRPSFTRIMASLNKKAGLPQELISEQSAWYITTADSDGDYREAGSSQSQLPVAEEKNDLLVRPSHTKAGKASVL